MTDFDDDDEVVIVGRRLPRLVSIAPMDAFHVAVTWETGTREKEREVVDLAVLLARFKVYAPLRDDPELFRSVRLQEHRYGVAWGDGTVDMGASTIADAADEAMTAEDFSAFMDRHGFTLDRVAAELGISRRMAAYYKREHRVPRTVALACRYLEMKIAVATDRMTRRDDVETDTTMSNIEKTSAGKIVWEPETWPLAPSPANDEDDVSLEALRTIAVGIISGQITEAADIKRIAGFMLHRMNMQQLQLRNRPHSESNEHAQLG